MHQLDREACDSLARAKAKALKINQVHNEAVECKLECCLEEGILALCEAMEYADLPTIGSLVNVLVKNASVNNQLSF